MPYCGERYVGRLKTHSFTLEKPYGAEGLASLVANSQWKKLAETLWGEAWDALEALGRVESKLGKGYPRYEEIAPEFNAARQATIDLPSFSLGDTVPEAIAASKQWTCVLDKISAAMEAYGETPRTDTGPGDKWGWLWGLGFVAAVGGLVYVAEKKGG